MYSPAGSDDEQLVIDDPCLPMSKRARTPQDFPIGSSHPEGSALSPKIPRSPIAHAMSPLACARSPAAVSIASGSEHSPCMIDDDLMDAALLSEITKDE